MLISGLQKMTLLDYPGRVACTVFTGGCNFRCPFCHNASLVIPEALRAADGGVEAILAFLKKRQGLLDGVAITGGEPLLHADMADLLRQIRALGYQIKLDTNGSFPERLISLVEEGLVFPLLDIAPIERSKNYLLEGHVEYEFRTTVVKGLHTAESLTDAARWIEGAKEYYLQQFKDSGELLAADGLGAFDDDEMRALADAVRPIIPTVQLRGVD